MRTPWSEAAYILLNLLILGILPAIGLIVLLIARRTVRLKHGKPTCFACEYDLTGIARPDLSLVEQERFQCPECSADLRKPRAITYGISRQKRRTMLAAGLLILLTLPLAMFSGYRFLRYTVDWSAFASTDWMLSHLDTPSREPELIASRLYSRAVLGGDSKRLQRVATLLLARQKDTAKAWNPKFGLIIEYAFDQGLLTNEQASEYACRAWEFGPRDRKPYIEVGTFNDQVDISLPFLPSRGGPFQDTISPRLGHMPAAASIVQIEVDGQVMLLDREQVRGLGDRSPPGLEELVGIMRPKRVISPSTLAYSYPGPGGTGVSARCMVPPSDKPRMLVIRTKVRLDEGLAATGSSSQASAASLPDLTGDGTGQESNLLSWTREEEIRTTLPPTGKPVRWLRTEDLAVPLDQLIEVKDLGIAGMAPKPGKLMPQTTLLMSVQGPLPALLIGRLELRTVGTASVESKVVATTWSRVQPSNWIQFQSFPNGLRQASVIVDAVGANGKATIPDEPLDVWFVPDITARSEIEGARRSQLDDTPVFDLFVSEVRLGQIRREH